MNNFKKNKISIHNILVALIFFIIGVFASSIFLNIQEKDLKDKDLNLFWDVWQIMDEKYPFTQPTDRQKIHGAIQGMVDSYDDDYSQFLPPEKTSFFTENVTGTFAGIGAEISIRDGLLTVISPLKDSPAQISGIKPGDVITKVNNIDITGETLDGAISKIRGKENTSVILTIYRAGEREPLEIEVLRKIINIPVLETSIIDDVFIISVYNFNDYFDETFKQAMIEFKNSEKNKLVLDLRNNPGGFLSASIEMASYFLPQGTIILHEQFDIDSDEIIYRSYGYDLLAGINPQIIVLQNTGSASASEIVSGALSDHDVAMIAGEQSYGKGSVQQYIQLSENTSLKVTIAKWLTPDRNEISEIGITPDYIIPTDYESIEDNQLQEALLLFK